MAAKGEGTILVVDDEPGIRKLLRLVFERRGYKVILAESGKEALMVSKRQPITLMFVDIDLGEMSGLELCPLLRC